jgi:hypothetical protein
MLYLVFGLWSLIFGLLLQYRERSDRMPYAIFRRESHDRFLLSVTSGRFAGGTVLMAILLSLVIITSIHTDNRNHFKSQRQFQMTMTNDQSSGCS